MGTHLGGNPIGPTGVQVPAGKKNEQNPHLKSMEFPGSLNGIYCQLGDYISPTTYQGNQKQLLMKLVSGTFGGCRCNQ